MTRFEQALFLPSGTVLRDGSHTIWEKHGYNYRRIGSTAFYDWQALVYPWEVLWSPT